MTYCVGLMVDEGMVLLSDTRTNAGLDNIATYRKMFTFEEPGERVIVILTAGSLSTTQTVIAKLTEDIEDSEATPETSFMQAPSMLKAVEIIGAKLSEVTVQINEKLGRMEQSASASFIVAGQRVNGDARMYLVYPEGNFIEATPDTPFLQIGEHKYGKPILDRVITNSTTLEDARKAALLSMDSTLRSNLSVGMPLDLVTIRANEYRLNEQTRFKEGDPKFDALSKAWSTALRESFASMQSNL